MKTKRFLWVLFMAVFFMVLCSLLSLGQPNQAEVPGDDFSLEGALEVFKKSTSPEDFERQLNSPDSKVNNLDLNGDGDIDYIKVIDRNEGNVHAFIIQAIISERESQDVAVIELEKLASGKAVLQIIGDADVYGMETIIEPTTEVRVNAGTSTTRSVVNVWAWPSVQYVYSPYYEVWVSPYRWTMRPIGWRPWRPVAYYMYDPWWQPYRSYYSVCYTHRVGYAHSMYRPMRTTSVYVYNRHRDQIDHYRSRQNSNTYYGERNDRSRDYQTSGSYDQRNDNQRERSSPSMNSPRPSTGGMNSQPDWRSNNNSDASLNQRDVNTSRSYSVDRMNRPTGQRSDRGTFTNQPQIHRTDVPRMTEGTERMNRPSPPSIDRESNSQRGQLNNSRINGPTREFNRQGPANNPGRSLPLSKPGTDRGTNQRGR